ncbi:hypothetical protein [Nocardia huaxiensis]|uniref:hypothetical protein n=1 Tax=Nocardia huaxiensis TaxID=2755382 RepID=UPI001E6447B8|nr:hypothetical protein [Nocardia huaxiensis]UFS93882.1 hypothetical protein LPY97_24215 [Nocardia huaxiensis]
MRERLGTALKAATVAVLSVSVIGATVGVAQADPAQTDNQTGYSIHGTAGGTGYFAHFTPNRDGVTTTLDSATFAVTSDATAVTVTANDGTVLGALPLTIHAAERDIALAPTIQDQGATLTLRPIGAPAPVALQDVATSKERWDEQVQRGTFGAMIGGAIGGLITIPFWIFILPPILGIGIGAGIGFLAAGGQPLLDAGIAYFTGQP